MLLKTKVYTLREVVQEAMKSYPGLRKEVACKNYTEILRKVIEYAKDIEKAERAYYKYKLLKLLEPEDHSWQSVSINEIQLN